MRALWACLLLLTLAACMERRLPAQEAQRIQSLLLVVEPFDEVAVTTSWADTRRSEEVYNPKTKRFDTILVNYPVRESGTRKIRTDLDVRARIRSILQTSLSSRYRIDESDRRVPVIKEAFNPVGYTVSGPVGLVADALEASIPAGAADAILVVRGPAGSMDYDYGYTAGRRERGNTARVQADYDFFLFDGRTFSTIAAIGPSFKPDRRPDAPPPIPRPSPAKYLSAPHGYRIAADEADDTDMARLRDAVMEAIDGAVPLQLLYIGLIEAAPRAE
jgi:hypothetical protein